MTLLALPMHGELKLRTEGLRTRDGHVLEWLSRAQLGGITVLSRPEPWPRLTLGRRRSKPVLSNSSVSFVSPEPVVPPYQVWTRSRRWWVDSLRWLPQVDSDIPVLAWNPFAAAELVKRRHRGPIVMDLLDDWTLHPLFQSINAEVSEAYAEVMDAAAAVTTNGEGTLALARALGRKDALMVPNGVDPGRFSVTSNAVGPRTVVGYAGKIGSRLDIELIELTVTTLPGLQFCFAGPVLERHVGRRLNALPNLTLLGDIHYDRYPNLLTTWDIGWIPHRTGPGEVGGDVIKTYEFRASGLPTLSTPFVGANRLQDVIVEEPSRHPSTLQDLIEGGKRGPRVPRVPTNIPDEHTWQFKAGLIGGLLPLPE